MCICCVVPVDQTSIRSLYVFVEIAIDPVHVCATIRTNFPSTKGEFAHKVLQRPDAGKPKIDVNVDSSSSPSTIDTRPTHLVLVATVQFINALQSLKERLEQRTTRQEFDDAAVQHASPSAPKLVAAHADEASASEAANTPSQAWHASEYRITIPQTKPLSPGEILGCTSPKLSKDVADDVDGIIYVGDGRFHLESIMISNPRIAAFRYDPYEKRFVREGYDHQRMRSTRSRAVEEARETLQQYGCDTADTHKEDVEPQQSALVAHKGWGLVLGTLGRQGSTKVLSHLTEMIAPTGMPVVPILLSELSPQKLSLFGTSLLSFVQTSCPRLSIDWGDAFPKPLLSPYEAAVALGKSAGWQDDGPSAEEGDYPMDFYSDHSRGPWTPRHGLGVRKAANKGISNRELLKRGGLRRQAARAQQAV